MGHVCSDVLHGKIGLVALERRIQLRELVEGEVASRDADVMRDARRLVAETIVLETKADNGVVVRPDRAGW